MLNTPFSPWPAFTAEEVDAVKEVLLSGQVNYLTGTQCREFEREFAQWSDSNYAIALMNGTVALDVSLRVLGIGTGDEVVVTPRSFIASASCVVNAGATPVFAEVDADSGNITATNIEAVLSSRTKAVICVHLAGWPCDLDPIMAMAEKHGFFVIEDCAQAHGARYKGRSVGSIGHLGAWSFCQDKIMTTGGEGGMVTCNDEELWRAIWSFKDHGKSYAAMYERPHLPGFRWLHEGFGTNLRMTEMQAVIGRIQLKRMHEWRLARTMNAQVIREVMLSFATDHGVVRAPIPDCSTQHAYYKLYVYVRPENLNAGWSRDRIVDEINARNVPCYTGSCPEIYLEKAFEGTDFRPVERLPIAKQLGETSLMFLVHPTLTEAEIRTTVCVIKEIFEKASKRIESKS